MLAKLNLKSQLQRNHQQRNTVMCKQILINDIVDKVEGRKSG